MGELPPGAPRPTRAAPRALARWLVPPARCIPSHPKRKAAPLEFAPRRWRGGRWRPLRFCAGCGGLRAPLPSARGAAGLVAAPLARSGRAPPGGCRWSLLPPRSRPPLRRLAGPPGGPVSLALPPAPSGLLGATESCCGAAAGPPLGRARLGRGGPCAGRGPARRVGGSWAPGAPGGVACPSGGATTVPRQRQGQSERRLRRRP